MIGSILYSLYKITRGLHCISAACHPACISDTTSLQNRPQKMELMLSVWSGQLPYEAEQRILSSSFKVLQE